MEEVWRNVVHYEGLYEVSNLGRVRNKDGHIMAQFNNGNGYMQLSLTKFGKSYHEYVHRLVAMAFIPNPDNKPQVDHRDTVRSNNEVSNLRWVTASENDLNECTVEKKRHSNSCKQVQCIETGKIYFSTSEVARQFGLKGIRDHLMGKSKSFAGYHWRYI